MPRRKELLGIAAGVAQSFISRNNDVDGYWAMGILYTAVVRQKTNTFELNLLSGESTPEFKYSKKIAEANRQNLKKQLANLVFEEYQVTEANLLLEFDTRSVDQPSLNKTTWGEPFLCRVTIIDDLKKKHSFEARGWCGRHCSVKERRSTRSHSN